MADLKSFELPLYRQALSNMGDAQSGFSDWLVEKNNPAAFLAYFLSGGHDSGEGLKNLGEYGFSRPQQGNISTAKDVLSASGALGYLPLLSVPKALTKAGSSALQKIASSGTTNMSRREAIKNIGGLSAVAAVAPKMLIKSEAPEAASKTIAKKVAPSAPAKMKSAIDLDQLHDDVMSKIYDEHQDRLSDEAYYIADREGLDFYDNQDEIAGILDEELLSSDLYMDIKREMYEDLLRRGHPPEGTPGAPLFNPKK